MIKDDYAKVNIPMLPVVKGVKNASMQILLYSILLVFITILIVTISPSLGWIYVISSIILGIILIIKAFYLFKIQDRTSAVSIYKYSLIYLFLLIGFIMIDSSINFLEI